MDGLLDQSKPHETNPIPAKFPGVEFNTGEADGTATDQDVANKNTMAAGTSANSGIVYGTPHIYVMEGTAPPPLAAND